MSQVKLAILALAVSLFCLLGPIFVSAEETGQDRDRPLTFGYSSQVFFNVDPRDAVGLIQTYDQILAKKTKSARKRRLIFFNNLDDLKRALKANEVDIIVCIAEEFIHLREMFSLKPVLSSDYGKHFYDHLLLLVRNDSGIDQLGQLRSKNLRIESGQKGTLPIKWLNSMLMAKFSSGAENFFADITACPKASQALLPLFFGKTDACLVSRTSFETMVELNPQLGRTLHVLAKSPGFATGIIAVRQDVSDLDRDATVAAIRDIHTDPKGRQILTLFRINRLVDFEAEHLSAIKKVLKVH